MNLLIKTMLSLLLFSTYSCKKCIVCRNYCYQCDKLQGLQCNTDFETNQVFDTIMKLNSCKSVNPSIEYKICDRNETSKNLKQLNEYARYVCD
jgi:hypothetical protein